MQQSSDILGKVTYLVGSADIAARMQNVPSRPLFDSTAVDFLNEVSRELMADKEAKAYSDVVTFGFWIRKSSTLKLRERFAGKEGIHLGRGVAFHVAPSNVPVNFAYSLVSGLLTGNKNVVRVPSRDFPQVKIIADALNRALQRHADMRPYVLCVRYDRDKDINDYFSSIADVRVVWGGDQTISELRKSPLPPRAGEITFADRYSLALIDADSYLAIEDKARTAEDFYNDTFFSDQNACTSPRIVIWTGRQIGEAKKIFWEEEHKLVKKKYLFQPIQAVNKLVRLYLAAAAEPGIRAEEQKDNLIVRVAVSEISGSLMNHRDNSGYFYEYDCGDIMELVPLCDDKHCQTVAYIGDKDAVLPLIRAGIRGIDRVVPMGKTMDFDLIWDGYNLPELLTRTIVMA